MITKNNATKTDFKTDFNATRYVWFGCAMGLACMAALFIAGLITGNAGMTVMAATMAGLVIAICSSTVAATKKKAANAESA